MRLGHLIEQLTDLAEKLGDEAEVRLAHQPRWAFEYSLRNLADADGIVYLGEGNQIGYLPQSASVALEWSEGEETEEDEDE